MATPKPPTDTPQNRFRIVADAAEKAGKLTSKERILLAQATAGSRKKWYWGDHYVKLCNYLTQRTDFGQEEIDAALVAAGFPQESKEEASGPEE